MKKLLLLLALTIGLFQVTNAQCPFTYTVSGNAATFTPTPFIVIGTTVMDSLVYDYGDGTGTFNIPLSQTSNSHAYAAGGTYNVCHTYYMHQLGSPTNSFTCFYCDSVTIQGAPPACNTTLAATGNAGTITAIATGSFGTPPYTYSYTLNPGSITNTTGVFTGLSLGLYSVCATATDAMNQTCTTDCDSVTAGISFVCNTSLSLSTSGSTITSTPTTVGGTAPYAYSYTLNPGNITNGTGVFSNLTNGAYTVCVTSFDAFQNQCSAACDSISVGGTTVFCSNNISIATSGTTATATTSTTGGTAPYTYTYTLNPGNISNGTGVFTGLANGNYTICVSSIDAMSQTCTPDCDSFTIGSTVPCATTINATAFGSTINAVGMASGGTAPYTYLYTLNPGNISNTTGSFTGLSNGIYIVCVTALDAMQNICSSACDTLTVNNSPQGCAVNAAFSETITGTTVSFTNNSSILNGTITNFNWSFGDGSFSTAGSPVHTYALAGTYTVIFAVNGIDSNQVFCIDSATKAITVTVASAVSNTNLNTLKVFPNPTSNNFTIDLPTNETFEKLVITDVSGRKVTVETEKATAEKLIINLKNSSSGIYFIKLQTNKNFYTSSIMKQE